ncbi:MAG: HEAT repeat domain-containing protein [Planctomycetota bacterium]
MMMQPLITACWIALGVMVQEPEPQALPEVPDGFSIELIAEAPEIRWPSAVHCLDDGSLLVAEDPMDMPGPTDQPIDRIWLFRWNEDGTHTKTVFAEKLFAVFGLQQIDDAIYVMNMPHLTVLRDRDGDGVAEERRVLIDDLGPPAPGWAGGFNDHIVTGIRLAMDGFLYVSVGDKGVPKATGTDGKTITLRGGGVVRVRPDGTDLEVVASGTRNHLDVAMTSKDDIFTYDNTDDGLGWWTRFTHIIRGGYYGYPWDYHDHQDRMLLPMADYGGGSPVGGLAYRGGVWPAQFDDNLLFCEWGKGVVRRLVVRPSGSTYAVDIAEDFVRSGKVQDFRPLDICESPDGRFVYIADWGYPGWRQPNVTGRVFRLRRADDEGPATTQISNEASLTSVSYRQRLVAQRALARRGLAAVPELAGVVRDSTSRRARRHAIWALESIGGDEATRHMIAALAHPDADTRAQAARALGERRLQDAAPLLPLLADADPVVRREAAAALGRVGDHAATGPLVLSLLREDDAFLRFSIRKAIQRIDHWTPVVAALETAPETALPQILLTFHEQYSTGLVDALLGLMSTSAQPERRALALGQLARLHRKPAPWDGKWWSIQPARDPRPAPAIDWERTGAIAAAIRAAFQDSAPEVRAAALEAVSWTKDRSALPEVRRLADDPDPSVRLAGLRLLGALRDDAPSTLASLRATLEPGASSEAIDVAVTALRQIDTPGSRQALIDACCRKQASRDVIGSALAALSEIGDEQTVSSLRALNSHPEGHVRIALTQCAASIGGSTARSLARTYLKDPDPAVRREATRASATLRDTEAVPDLIRLVEEDPGLRGEAIDALTSIPNARALDAYLAGLTDGQSARRAKCVQALGSIRDAVRSELESRQIRGELPPAALVSIRSIYQDPQPVREWQILGPFPKKDDLPRDFFSPMVVDGAPVVPSMEGGAIDWQFHTTDRPHGFIDLRAMMTPNTDCVAYAATWLQSTTARTAKVAVGSDDQVSVFVNGEEVHHNGSARGWTPDQDRIDVKLQPGLNAILVRIGQDGGDWSFNFKIADQAKGPLFDIGDAIALDQEDYRAHAIKVPGNASVGREIFRDRDGVGCVRCHVAEGVGERVGPELSDVGVKYPRAELITSILEPSQRIGEGYRAIGLELEDGRLVFGMPLGEENGRLRLVDSQGEPLTIRTGDIVERWTSPLSPMPNGLQSGLTLEQFADLVAYLESLQATAEDSGDRR